MSALGFRKVGIFHEILSIEADVSHEPALIKTKKRIEDFDYLILAAGNRSGSVLLYTPYYKNIALHCLTSANLDHVKSSVSRDYSKKIVNCVTYKKTRVNLIPLDWLRLDPCIIKIDVEGFDAYVIDGLLETIKKNTPIILIEFTPSTFKKIHKVLKQFGYDFFIFNSGNHLFKNLFWRMF